MNQNFFTIIHFYLFIYILKFFYYISIWQDVNNEPILSLRKNSIRCKIRAIGGHQSATCEESFHTGLGSFSSSAH